MPCMQRHLPHKWCSFLHQRWSPKCPLPDCFKFDQCPGPPWCERSGGAASSSSSSSSCTAAPSSPCIPSLVVFGGPPLDSLCGGSSEHAGGMARSARFLYMTFGAGTASGVALTLWGHDKWPDTWKGKDKQTATWNYNWDRFDVNNNAREIESAGEKTRATRHIILIRHGQYNTNGSHDGVRKLTTLGREQADLTGIRLQQLGFPFSAIISSTMTRASETADIIARHFPDVTVQRCPLICEGAPIPPEPPLRTWTPDKEHFIKDGQRIESAFRTYFHRAAPTQEKDSYDLLVCHANVIRYFVCRALQFPPEAWLRLNLHNGSITWLSIRPSGRVTLRVMGDSGHIPPEKITSN